MPCKARLPATRGSTRPVKRQGSFHGSILRLVVLLDLESLALQVSVTWQGLKVAGPSLPAAGFLPAEEAERR